MIGFPFWKPRKPPRRCRPVLLVVEGRYDVRFLQTLATILHAEHPAVPDLARATAAGRVIWFPVDGDLTAWTDRLAPLHCPEFHLYDRELAPETERRLKLLEQIRRRERCQAQLTTKRALENYLHPQAITAATGVTLDFGDDDHVPELFTRSELALAAPTIAWSLLPRRNRLRRMQRAKRRLNFQAVRHMTPELLAARDSAGELRCWLQKIGSELSGAE